MTAKDYAEAWSLGIIAPWYLKKFQYDVYELFLRHRFPFAEESRRIGKTTVGLVFVQEFLRSYPQRIWRWCEPWKYQAREIVMPEMDRIQETCPSELKFRFYKTDSFYELPTNGSRLYLRGINEDRGESARGSFAHGITLDELGSVKELHYIKNEVLLPQLLSTNGALHQMSTPPRDLGHLYYEEREKAVRDGRFIQRTIRDALGELYTLEQIEQMCEAVGGPDSPAWRREFLCEPVSDPEMLVIPEWSDDANIVPDDYPRPEWPTFYVAGDSGLDDNTALLFGWYDFTKDETVIEREYVVSGKTTTEIITAAKMIERELWGGDTKPHKRVYDADKQLIYDIFADHKWPVQMPRKEDKTAAIHDLRVEVGARRFKVKASCKNLIRQMKVGMWKNERHTDFQRSEGLGHLDCIAAAIYFNRSIDRKLNPVPPNYGLRKEIHFINQTRTVSRGNTEETLAKLFGSRGRR